MSVDTELDELLTLAEDWDSYGAQPMRPRAITMARNLWRQLHAQESQMPDPWVVPISDGGVNFEWHTGGWDIEVEVPDPMGGYSLWWRYRGVENDPECEHTFSIEPLLRVCQRFVTATAREVR